jgi:hypothetical protein
MSSLFGFSVPKSNKGPKISHNCFVVSEGSDFKNSTIVLKTFLSTLSNLKRSKEYEEHLRSLSVISIYFLRKDQKNSKK